MISGVYNVTGSRPFAVNVRTGAIVTVHRFYRREDADAFHADALAADWRERHPDFRCPECDADIGDGPCESCPPDPKESAR